MSAATLLQTSFSDLKLVRRGKVRDVYAIDDDSLLIVATDRISAFDCILPTPIERKGEVLTALSEFRSEERRVGKEATLQRQQYSSKTEQRLLMQHTEHRRT